MDFNVVVGAPGVVTEAPSTPAREAARAEWNAVMSDPAHPVHGAYTRGQTAIVEQHLKPFYEKAAAESPPVSLARESVSLGPVEPQPGETPEAAAMRQRNEVILAPLKQEWGPHYEARMATVPGTVNTLFEGQWAVLDDLGETVRMTYGPKGEAAVLKLFAELEDIKQGG